MSTLDPALLHTASKDAADTAAQHEAACCCPACLAAKDAVPTDIQQDFPSELSANTGTAGRIDVGDTVTSQIETSGDTDWFRITLTAGETYRFDLQGVGGSGELSDPLLQLYRGGNIVASDDDGGVGLDSRITYTASTSGTYYLSAEAFGSNIHRDPSVRFCIGLHGFVNCLEDQFT